MTVLALLFFADGELIHTCMMKPRYLYDEIVAHHIPKLPLSLLSLSVLHLVIYTYHI